MSFIIFAVKIRITHPSMKNREVGYILYFVIMRTRDFIIYLYLLLYIPNATTLSFSLLK